MSKKIYSMYCKAERLEGNSPGVLDNFKHKWIPYMDDTSLLPLTLMVVGGLRVISGLKLESQGSTSNPTNAEFSPIWYLSKIIPPHSLQRSSF